MYFIGLDLGGTKIATALINERGEVFQTDRRMTEAHKGPAHVFAAMKASINAVTGAVPMSVVEGIGLGIPGLVDLQKGASIFAGNLGWDHVPVLDVFKREYGRPVFMDNDVRVAALGERHFGAGQGIANLIYITVGTGVGSGIIIDGRLFRGTTDNAGEIGHMTIDPDGLTCNCGNRGCLEVYASAPAIARRTRAYIQAGHFTKMTAMVEGDLARISAAVLSQAVEAGDGLAQRIMEETAEYLGIGLASYINLINPTRVIIGGGVSLAGEKLFAPLRQVIQKRAMQNIAANVEIRPALLGDRSGMIGAAALAMEHLGCK
ncbi:ROK family protein [Heliobacterium gestii]|uniref:ROK family protein n=1 Tax=Heliomicrobium gestii TaxID=2699 RepID=A0A845LJ76_HELGE|nr:ROK family protein [Heliomicrobium gestii]MBM7868446.1 glucokinase [Heliomicrobium gestii]MZP44619.1 ROK family protein [Heliomicrobium gestii]